MSFHHQPVMVQEVLDFLTTEETRGGWVVDATLGGGGHAAALLEARSDLSILGLDRDTEAVAAAKSRLAGVGARFCAVHTAFHRIAECVEGKLVRGVLMDLGISSHQIDTPERGFSFQRDGALDMRMDQTQRLTAEEVVNTWEEEKLANLFWEYGEERRSRRVAKWIVEDRKGRRIRTTTELADRVARAIGGRAGGWKIHPATRVFQALRIAVNDELGELKAGLDEAWKVLEPGGRLVVISFHSLEDRMVKRRFRDWAGETGEGRLLTRKPMEASEEEIRENPRARSAKLRAIEKMQGNEEEEKSI